MFIIGMLKHTEGFVMKPVQNDVRGQTEIEFYKSIFLSPSANSAVSKLQQLIPKFLGIHSFSTNTAGKNAYKLVLISIYLHFIY